MALPARLTARRASLSAAAAVLLAGTVAALVVAGGPGSVAATGEPGAHSVTVSGLGQANGTPDVLRLDLGVQRSGLDVNTALNAANDDIKRIKAALARHGVKDADIQTSQLSINQHYGPIQPYDTPGGTAPGTATPNVAPPPAAVAPMSEPEAREMGGKIVADPAPPSASGSGSAGSTGVAMSEPAVAPDAPVPAPGLPADDPAVLGTEEGKSYRAPAPAGSPGWVGYDRPNGYDVFQSLTVKLRNLDDAGGTISDAAEAGGDATRINGVSFDIEDDEALLREARDAAFADARAKAEQYARLAGRSLGRVTTISEGNSGGGSIAYPGVMRDSAAAGNAVPIQAGSQQVTVTSTVVWELN